jgi:hypothetical protein
MPNSEAELAAYGKAMAEYVKEMATYNEAIEGQSRSRNRGQKRSHHGNGNGNYIDSNPDADPDASAQLMERARSSPSLQLLSSTMANPNGQATQNSVLQTLPKLLNDEFLLVLNSLNHTAQLEQQLAREEAAKLKERVKTALDKAIGWATAAGSYGSQLPNQTQVLQTIPDLVLETPNSAPEAHQNLALEPNTLALQARTLLGNQNSFPQTSNTWALVTLTLDEQQPSTNAAAATAATSAAAAVPKHSRNQGPSNAVEGSQGRHEGRHAPKRLSNPPYGPRRPGLAAAQHQSIEGQGLSMPIIAIQNAISWSNSEPQNKFINKYHYIVLDSSLYYRVNNSKQSCNDSTNNANFLAEQKSTKNFQKRSKFSQQKFRKFRQISMSKNVIRMVLGRSRKKFSHKNIISNKIPKKLLKH